MSKKNEPPRKRISQMNFLYVCVPANRLRTLPRNERHLARHAKCDCCHIDMIYRAPDFAPIEELAKAFGETVTMICANSVGMSETDESLKAIAESN